ncbi:MAG TPA: chemotaxis protein CheW [Deltaproteobacteria bacterium]|nr:MAG: chemotaxis protein CheW [Deltaproteobacteria bacterium GWA2_55_82]OGQ62893.1 MAG: chemotaxis protein CheW [Deltaproteobacteria bacterium RIFCSPLOWO2_02_FULL_55_12]OIJ72854.1 MAG: chemotaxis protein CheW [Deltaproteobacteria bacterium GWC2_55_46]HBG46135.1 chemotaxis protein CheW [Deltaproteobacteria bacterium]HCY11633.1 chemotaxis protein CheW [Deltaproteobacteria bacterium]
MDPKKELDLREVLQLVTFRLGNEEFSLDILRVQEIIRHMEITRVPKAPDFVEGVINLRGKVIPVLELRKRFGLGSNERTNETRIIVVEVDDKTVGLKVDAVSEVLRLPADRVEPPPAIATGVDSDYIKGVGKLDGRLLILLDVEKVLTKSEKDALGAVA